MTELQTKFLKILENKAGNISQACKACNIGRQVYYDWLKKAEDDGNGNKVLVFEKAAKEVKENLLDFAESKLLQRMKGYNHPEDKIFQYEGEPIIVPTTKHYPPDVVALIFFLKTQGKSRGYIERTEQEVREIRNITVEILPSKEPDKLSDAKEIDYKEMKELSENNE